MASKASSAPKNSKTKTDTDILSRFDDAVQAVQKARDAIGQVVLGQQSVIDQTLISLLSGGHVLLVGVPGLAKTLLIETTATVLGLSTNRVQCTPDLMPADILGSEILEESAKGTRSFRFIKGPVFCQILMADEINRASPRTQSALLQAMQERQIAINGKNHPLPKPFHVLATQNPIEQEGTYPLPEAQLDRFFLQIDVGYPDLDAEKDMILKTTGNKTDKVKAVMSPDELMNIQNLVRDMPIGENVVDAILTLVRQARPETSDDKMVKDFVHWPPGPRASQIFMLATRARALLEGRETPSVEDVVALAKPVMRHRMALNYKARAANITMDDILSSLCKTL